MFSASENIKLRQHKRRIVQYVEECIPEDVLDAGTSVMAMQITCNTPGCVPLETVIAIVFPRIMEKNGTSSSSPEPKQIMKGVKESKGSTFKSKVLMPMAEVTKEDILDALPPDFIGGRRTMQKLCYKVRDLMIGQISQLMGDEDREGKSLLANFLIEELKEYVALGCTVPPVGEPFPKKTSSINVEIKEPLPSAENDAIDNNSYNETLQKIKLGKGNIVIRRPVEEDEKQIQQSVSSNNEGSSSSSRDTVRT